MPKNPLIRSVSTLVGYVIGAGILALPFAVSKSGYITGAVLIAFLGFAVMIVYLYLGEVVLRTKGNHQIPGLAERYIGKAGKEIMYWAMVLGGYGTLTAYMIKEGDFLGLLISPFIGGSPLLYSYLFFAVGSVLLYFGIKMVQRAEVLLVAFIVLVIIFIFIATLPYIHPQALLEFDIAKLFVPYGVIFFAFGGIGAIPEMHAGLLGRYRLLKPAIIIGTLISIIVYLLFPFSILGSLGPAGVTEGTIGGLQNSFGYLFFVMSLFFGMLTMATSFLAVGLAIKEVFRFDARVGKFRSWFYTIIGPVVLFHIMLFSAVDNAFFRIIDLTGAVSGSILGIGVVLMFWKARKFGDRKPEFNMPENKVIGYVLIAVFIIGMMMGISQVLS